MTVFNDAIIYYTVCFSVTEEPSPSKWPLIYSLSLPLACSPFPILCKTDKSSPKAYSTQHTKIWTNRSSFLKLAHYSNLYPVALLKYLTKLGRCDSVVKSLSWPSRSYFTATLGLFSTIKIINKGQRVSSNGYSTCLATPHPKCGPSGIILWSLES